MIPGLFPLIFCCVTLVHVFPVSALTCHMYDTPVSPIPVAVDTRLNGDPSATVTSSGQLMSVIADPASRKSFTPFPSWSSCVLLYPLTDPLELIVGFAPPSIPSSLESLSVEVPYASSTS